MIAVDRLPATVARTKQEILADIAAGILPATVKTYSELTIMSMQTGRGACENMPLLEDDDSNIAECHANTDFWNIVHDEIDEWLRAGRPA